MPVEAPRGQRDKPERWWPVTYGHGDVSCHFPGLARTRRQKETPNAALQRWQPREPADPGRQNSRGCRGEESSCNWLRGHNYGKLTTTLRGDHILAGIINPLNKYVDRSYSPVAVSAE